MEIVIANRYYRVNERKYNEYDRRKSYKTDSSVFNSNAYWKHFSAVIQFCRLNDCGSPSWA